MEQALLIWKLEDPANFKKLEEYPPGREINGRIKDLDPRAICVMRTFFIQLEGCMEKDSDVT